MCIICVEFEKGKLSLDEAVRNYGEMKETLPEEHQKEVEALIFNNFPFYHGWDDEYWEETGFGD
tara:strand:+ start:72 stop:263 length:192 start_codon:yes stop_codon:yes gene_type:complete